VASLTILIIRHAEKPKGAWPGPGLTIGGAEDKKSLVIRGWQRAGAWAALFSHHRGGDDFPRPDVIYAADPDAPGATSDGSAVDDDEDSPSQRPFETVTPLAARLRQTVSVDFAQGQESALAAAVVKLTGVVLIAWEHKHIINPLLADIAGGQSLPLPTKWPRDRFDVVLRFDRSGAGEDWKFQQLFPKLLCGDSDAPLPTV
jgi:hypothetical protein